MDWSFLNVDAHIDESLLEFESDAMSRDVWMQHATESFAGNCGRLIGMGIVFYKFNSGTDVEMTHQLQYRSVTRAHAGVLNAYLLNLGFDYHDMVVQSKSNPFVCMFAQEPDIIAMVAARWPAVAAKRIALIQAYIESGLEDASSTRAVIDMHTYRDWRADRLKNELPACRAEFACRFMKNRNESMMYDARIINRMDSMRGDFYRDAQPWQTSTSYDCLGFKPAQFGAEARLMLDAKIAWVGVINRLVPELLCISYVNEPVLLELQTRERSARAAMETVAMAQLHHECAIPLDLVDLIVGYVHPWHGTAPKMKLTPEQQVEQAAFEARHG
jgi:hypothetical protein